MAGTETAEDVFVVDLRGVPPGLRVRLRRRALGLSQWDVAQRLGITQSAVSQAECGRVEARQLELALQEIAAGGGTVRSRSVTRP